MSQDQTTIACPECGTEIDVNDILYHQVDEQLRKKYQDELRGEQDKLQKQSAALREQQSKQSELLAQQVREQLKEKETILRKSLKQAAEDEQQGALSTLREELEDKSAKLKAANKATAELEKLRRDKDELEEKLNELPSPS